jgi:cytochrome c oxidase subunit 2
MGMKRADHVALALVLASLVGIPAAVFSYQALRGEPAAPGEILVVARTVEHGGWSPPRIVVKQHQRVRLRILAEDVTHGFRLLHFGVSAGPIKTGSTSVVDFTADRTGEFPFYCSVRCSPLHMALMGTLVVEPAREAAPTVPDTTRRAPGAGAGTGRNLAHDQGR